MSVAARSPVLLRLDAAGVLDPAGVALEPGSLVVELSPTGSTPTYAIRVLACDRPGAIDKASTFADAIRVSLADSVLIPGLVNAHTHLDLSGVGPRPFDPDRPFADWLSMVVRERPRTDPEIEAAVNLGVDLLRRGGVVAVGDIAGALGPRPTATPWKTLAASSMRGVSFVESFGMGPGRANAAASVRSLLEAHPEGCKPDLPVRLGLSPHAPVSVDRRVYAELAALAREFALPLCTHLSESPDEHLFIGRGEGPVRAFLESMRLWDEQGPDGVGDGATPIGHMAELLRDGPTIAVHVNDASDRDIEILAETGTPVIYCPRASSYFGFDRSLGPHRYREMRKAGVRVAIGTDSIINLPASCVQAGGSGLSTLDDLRLIYQRGDFGRSPAALADLLLMATIEGAGLLGLDASGFTIGAGSTPLGIVAVPVDTNRTGASALERVFSGDFPPRLLLNGK
ncbi:MAG: amidohydrolase family protein [Phycisphaerales bacterium]|nr:amidohydrolase family protein [Phycisphaerales bacterium]